jgi:hypothetical protein
MSNSYLEVISLVERLHRQFLEVVKLELEGLRIHDINNVQAMMLFNIGDAEMTVGELTLRGCYLGSNVSYNVKKIVENGYSGARALSPRPALDTCSIAAGQLERYASAPRRFSHALLAADGANVAAPSVPGEEPAFQRGDPQQDQHANRTNDIRLLHHGIIPEDPAQVCETVRRIFSSDLIVSQTETLARRPLT